jgi:hypothetical protein
MGVGEPCLRYELSRFVVVAKRISGFAYYSWQYKPIICLIAGGLSLFAFLPFSIWAALQASD